MLTAALTGALQRSLWERRDRVDELSIRAIVPLNRRRPGVSMDLPHGSWFALAFVELPIATRAPEAAPCAVHATIERVKARQEPLVSRAVRSLIGMLPSGLGRALDATFAHGHAEGTRSALSGARFASSVAFGRRRWRILRRSQRIVAGCLAADRSGPTSCS